jgi:hypothetical protein
MWRMCHGHGRRLSSPVALVVIVLAHVGFLTYALIVLGWIYWLTARVQLLLSLAEQIVDRDHTMPTAELSTGKHSDNRGKV